MSTQMYDAREAFISGCVYYRSNQRNVPISHSTPQFFPRPGTINYLSVCMFVIINSELKKIVFF